MEQESRPYFSKALLWALSGEFLLQVLRFVEKVEFHGRYLPAHFHTRAAHLEQGDFPHSLNLAAMLVVWRKALPTDCRVLALQRH
jgi:hypothetical protein